MDDNIFYLTGGEARNKASSKKEWHRYEKGIILKVDINNRSAKRIIEYISPPEVCPDDKEPAILFKAGSIKNGKLYVCTQTELLIYSFPEFKLLNYITLPCFNDIHYVKVTINGTLLIANSGLDMIIEITEQGDIVNEWSVIGENIWKRFDKNVDYRKVLSTKPHKSHPNFVFNINEEIWATRFECQDAICLKKMDKTIKIDAGNPHDGIIFKNKIYFTTVNGNIVVFDKNSLCLVDVFDLYKMTELKNAALGWCRGIKILKEELVVVGFGRLRPTIYQENIRWAKYIIGATRAPKDLPTRIACYDLKKGKCLWDFNVEDYKLNAIFSIL